MKGAAVALATGFVALLAIVLAIAAMFGANAAGCTPAAGSPAAVQGLPAQAREFAPLYVEAAAKYELGERGAPILAAIHSVESGFGTNMGPSSAGAVGHMQFLPSTWATYGVDADGDGRADPLSAADAIHSAARYLRASGAPRDWPGAIFAYNHADWYVDDVLRTARQFGELGTAGAAVCGGSAGPAELDRAVRLFEPARDFRIPSAFMAPGYPSAVIDARIWPNVRWVLTAYGLVITAGKETGHLSHGDGSAIDAVPAAGDPSSWERSAERAARDFGWTPSCASAGTRPACPLIPAIEFIGYNGYQGHGDPAHTSSPHIHISWVSSTHGTPQLTTPEWILAFPVPGEPS